MNRTEIDNNSEEILYNDICSVIEHTRYRVAVYVNSEASLMNWHIGKRIKEDVLYNKRADYGKEILKRLSQTHREIRKRLGVPKTSTLCTRRVHFLRG